MTNASTCDTSVSSKSIKTNDKKDDGKAIELIVQYTVDQVLLVELKLTLVYSTEFRVYDEITTDKRVIDHYKDMRTFQTVSFYKRMEERYSFEYGKYRALMTMDEAFDALEDYVVRNAPVVVLKCGGGGFLQIQLSLHPGHWPLHTKRCRRLVLADELDRHLWKLHWS